MAEKSAAQWLTIGELAARSGVAVSAIRFYEEKQLIWSVRTAGNQRRYQRAMLRRVAIVKAAQQVGIRLEQIKHAFEFLPKNRIASKADWQKMSAQWQEDLDQQIIGLLQIRLQLDQCIGCGCLSLDYCPLRNPGDNMAQLSPGAHFPPELLSLIKEKFLVSAADQER